MVGQRRTGIEEQVTRSAATLLYGHALAWDFPGRTRRTASARVAVGRRAGSTLARFRRAGQRPAVVPDAAPCG